VTSFRDEILAQPRNLEQVAASFLPALASARARGELRRFGCGEGAGPVIFTGMGASLFAALPAALTLHAAGRAAVTIPASGLLASGPGCPHAAYVAISQSGRSAETLAALRAAPPPRLALTNTASTPLASVADLALPVRSAPDASLSVRTYTASLLAAEALAATLLGRAPAAEAEVGELAVAMAELVDRADAVTARLAAQLGQARAVDLVGQGRAAAAAGYGALLLRETTRIPAAAFDTHQYLHGPIEIAEEGVAAVLFGSGRELRLARDLASTGAAVLLVTPAGTRPPDEPANRLGVIPLPTGRPALQPILEAVPVQLLAAQLASARGLVPGTFRHHQPDTKVEAESR
jgi:glucosamine--fructose-6-phosphate aminotransferase (isomerizing)